MKLNLLSALGGYAVPVLEKAGINGLTLDKPFVLFTGPNGSGKSAALRGIRASIGLNGERTGKLETEFQTDLDPKEAGADIERLATHKRSFKGDSEAGDHVPAVFNIRDLDWSGQPTYLFDSRAASSIASASSFDDDLGYHISLIVGGGKNVSHGQFVQKTWWEAIEWAAGFIDLPNPWKTRRLSPARKAVLKHALKGKSASEERWIFIDEPETAIDAETLLVGLASLIHLAEIGKLRVFCASHSLLFAAGLIQHEKVQVVDLGADQNWMKTQEIALHVAKNVENVDVVGADILGRIKSSHG